MSPTGTPPVSGRLRVPGAIGPGLVAAAGLTGVLGAVLVPARPHLIGAVPALVLVIPVVAGVAMGGLPVGVFGVAVAFTAYDLLFVRPFGSVAAANPQDWVVLGVYAVVMLVTARLVASLRAVQADARHGERATRRLFEVSDLLIGDQPLGDLLQEVAETVLGGFGLTSCAVLLPHGDQLSVAAHVGEPLPAGTAASLARPAAGTPLAQIGRDGLRTLPLVTATGPVGLLVLRGRALGARDQRLLALYANHAALAVERSRLREQALRLGVLAETDRWRRTLLTSVAHDLRTPLASIKAAVSDLADPLAPLGEQDRRELLATVEGETDRLSQLLANLLDVHRIEAGTRRLERRDELLLDLALEAVQAVGPRLETHPLAVEIPPGLAVTVDHTLAVQAFANLLDNAARHTPVGTRVRLSARARADRVDVALDDEGPGIPPDRLARLFDGAGPAVGGPAIGAGVGLTIARSFIEVQGGRIAAGRAPGGGLRLSLSLPAAGPA